MTGHELKTAVTEMGFARCLEENENYFFRVAGHALSTLARTFELSGEMLIDYTPSHGYYNEYDLSSLAHDFRALPDGCISVDGKRLCEGRDYLTVNGRLRIAKRPPCTLCVRYLRAPRPLTPDNMEKELDVVPIAAHLPPLLVASYLWLEDRPELATHYLSLYRMEAEEIRREMRRHTASYLVENGWDKA